jgi:hypothetical protein
MQPSEDVTRKIMTKMLGLKTRRNIVTYRKLPNREFCDLYFSPTTVRVINCTSMLTVSSTHRGKKHTSPTLWLIILMQSDSTVNRDAE